jgi:hypothetical protein
MINNSMKSFKEYFLENTFDPKEPIKIADIGDFVAKVDSGNDGHCVLHGDEIEINDDTVSFTTAHGKRITRPLIDTTSINIGGGVEEKRPIINLDFSLKGKQYKNQRFSVGNRETNDEKVLIGLKFLEPLNATIEC